MGVVLVVLGRDFTDVGHAVALGLGMAASTRFGRPRRWTRPALVLCGVGTSFGFLMLANTAPSLAIAAGAGLVCAVVCGAASSRSTGRYAFEPQMSHRVRSPGG